MSSYTNKMVEAGRYTQCNAMHEYTRKDVSYPCVLDWAVSDTPQALDSMPLAHKQYWAKQHISYELNEYGFRCGELSGEEQPDSITFIGCSRTVGVGMPKSKTWTHQLSDQLGLKEINLGISAGSTDSAYRVYAAWQYVNRSPITCLLVPPPARIELVQQETFVPVGNWTESIPQDVLINNLLDPALNVVRTQRNIDAIKWIASQTNSKLLIIEHGWQRIAEDTNSKQFDNIKARDGIHGGAKWHKHILHQFNNKLKEHTQ